MKKEKQPDRNLPVYYDTLKIIDSDEIEMLRQSKNMPFRFPRVSIAKYKTNAFRVINYHKHISRFFKDELYSSKSFNK